MEAYIPFILVTLFALVTGGIFFFGFHLDQTNKATLIYATIMLVFGILLGFLTYYNNKQDNLNLAGSYTWMQAFFGLLGIFHVWFMYKKLFWSKRDTNSKTKDSFLPEFLYSLFLATLVTVGILAALSYKGQTVLAGLFWAVAIPFMVPLIFIKAFDALNQIPKMDFSQKWAFSKEPIKEDNWHWVNEAWVEFEVYESWLTEVRRNGRKARFRIRAPRQVPMREVYRLAVREYNQKGPEIVLQDLGFEAAHNGQFWWLFSIKFVWTQPKTWYRSMRYLDPYKAVSAGEVLSTDIIVAQRMAFSAIPSFDDDGEIAMGEM
jgi:hypothetical protein